MAAAGGRPSWVAGTMGGHAQAQIHAQLLLRRVSGADAVTAVWRRARFVTAILDIGGREVTSRRTSGRAHRLREGGVSTGRDAAPQRGGRPCARDRPAADGTLDAASDPRSMGGGRHVTPRRPAARRRRPACGARDRRASASGHPRRVAADPRGRGTRARRRVRLGQVDDRAGDRAALAGGSGVTRRDHLRRTAGCSRWARANCAATAPAASRMIFQDPRAHTNPVHRIGDFLTESAADVEGRPRGRGQAASRGDAGRGRDRGRRPPPAPVPARAVRRDAAAGHHRGRAAGRATAAACRRADHRPRRHHPVRGDGDPRRAAPRPRPGDALHHPRPRARRRGMRPHLCHVRRGRSSNSSRAPA